MGLKRRDNFGGNRRVLAQEVLAPRDEAELLRMMREFRGRRLRVVGRLHSWSGAVDVDEVLVDLSQFQNVEVRADSASESASGSWAGRAEIGAGCQIKRVLSELERQGGFTLPALGLITEQTLVGAAATGTHGSGRHCLSHYVERARVALYDPVSGEPVIRVVDGGDELRGVRCGLGCLGIVTSVEVPVRRQYAVEEHFQRYDDLGDVLAAEETYPLQQFYLAPWRWDYFAHHRREVTASRSSLAFLYRLYWSVGMDIAFHCLIRLLARTLPAACTPFFYQRVMGALVPRGWKVVDRSDRQLVMEHELFRHIEIEMFVERSRLAESLDFLQWLLRWMGGESCECSASLQGPLEEAGLWDALQMARGRYLHHYPICIRKVLADDTLAGTASGSEPWYALSLISYAAPQKRAGFFEFAGLLARSMALLFGARPHWGKHFPLGPDDIEALYPEWPQFRKLVEQFDPHNVFGNAWTDQLLRRDERSSSKGLRHAANSAKTTT